MKININDIKPLADDLMSHCQQKLGFDHPPELFFQEDEQNATNTLGKTAYYSPGEKKVVIYVTGRHGKDVLRSLAHELVHHMQNCRGDFDRDHNTDPGYAQNDPHLRNMEAEAYLLGNLLFRDWEDGKKAKSLQENKEVHKMNIDAIKKLVKEQLLAILQEKKTIPQNEVLGLSSKEKMDKALASGDFRADVPDPRTHLNKYGDPINPDGSPRLHSKSHGIGELEAAELEAAELEEECEVCPDLQEGEEEAVEETVEEALCGDEETLEEDSEELEENETIQTPEQENTLYEARFRPRDTNLFNKLMKKWVK